MWKKLDLNDASAILKLRDCVLSNLNHPDEYVREDDETSFVGEHLGEFGVSFGSFENNTLVAYCALTTDLYGSREIREFEVCAPRPTIGVVDCSARQSESGFRKRKKSAPHDCLLKYHPEILILFRTCFPRVSNVLK